MELLILNIFICVLISFPIVVEKRRRERARERYYQTEYAAQTQNTYEQVMCDEGLRGEFLIYTVLESLEGPRKFLFNLYLPTRNGRTTELDVVLLHESGIYVFESKNYGGWIFGAEGERYWSQTLPAKRGQSQKYHFYNPILQNEGHLDRLCRVLHPMCFVSGPPPYYSYIVFGERCMLMDVPQRSGNHHVLNLGELFFAVWENAAKAGVRLTAVEIERLYERLEPYTRVNDAVKRAHVENIRLRYR